ncbi:hypothetical protein [Niallia sp. 03133]|uniref:hypothetical protein n=1 Tax=Niallia sp. 03133 TaxID=3458060 RepID=UPI00404421EA
MNPFQNRVHGAPVIGAIPIVPPAIHGLAGAGAIIHGAGPTSFQAGNPVVIYPYQYFPTSHSLYPNTSYPYTNNPYPYVNNPYPYPYGNYHLPY